MYLKKLEIHGFKSFADKTKLEFKPGITVVVGPNGSGKSNVADAVRWVLGEQSVKSLRGGKMEDVIFAGSEKRRSLGMAEVSLTIDNSKGIFPLEFTEVTVTRRLYRSGESDYLINRVPCRLKDIHELFMDTGVGREGISIIGQGKVDEILSVKPEERRGLIEEAAGIVKYRHRKREAARKLEDTEISLVRLNDIVGELSSQEAPLFEQARVARIYKDLKTEIDGLEIGLINDEIQNAKKRLANIEKNRLQDEDELEKDRTGYHAVVAKEEEYKLKLQKKEDDSSIQQDLIYQANIQLEKNEGEKKLLSERIVEIDKQRKNLKNDIKELQEELVGLNNEFQNHLHSQEKLKMQLEQSNDSLKQYEAFLEKESNQDHQMSEKLEELKNAHFEALQDETKVSNEIAGLTQRMETLNKQEAMINSKVADADGQMAAVQQKLAELNKEAGEYAALDNSVGKSLAENEKKYKFEEDSYQELVKNNSTLRDEKNNAAAKIKILAEMEREGQGYGQGVREILQQKTAGKFGGITGTVAQVLNVPKEYELAVEVALGNSLQHLITDNEAVAQEAVEWLKRNEKGRVTFLPLTTVKGTNPQDGVPRGKNVIGRMSELVQNDQKYKGIIEFLLGRIWLVDSLSTAVVQAKETGYRYRLVTLDGQVVNAGGSITGGSFHQNTSGILSRKRTIKELEEILQTLEARLTQGRKDQEEKEGILLRLQKSIKDSKDKLQELSIKRAENSKTQERWRADQERFKAEKETIHWQMAELTQEKEAVLKRGNEAEQEAVVLHARIGEMSEQVQTMQEKLRVNRIDRIKKNEKLTQMRIDVATIEEKMNAFQKENSYLSHRLQQVTQYRESKENESQALKDKKIGFEDDLRTQDVEKGKLHQKLLELEKQMVNIRSARNKLLESIEECGREAKRFSEQLRLKEEKLHQYELQQSKFEASLEGFVNRLFEQYGLDADQALEKGIDIKDRKAAQARTAIIKEEIAVLGEVNLGAIEEYARVKERLDFLTAQISDMTEAREKLQQVICEMEQIMIKRFKETFVLVNQAFMEMFVRLFNGGRAQLELTQQENLLESGVDIVVQPPGKKTQSLSLLSGGEKALTAIALLMAILKVKPSPFCVLDEIESNLDEANVISFAKMIQEFGHETQFIVISHRKGTMEIANVLYGITLEETGVSRTVSVKLEDIETEAS